VGEREPKDERALPVGSVGRAGPGQHQVRGAHLRRGKGRQAWSHKTFPASPPGQRHAAASPPERCAGGSGELLAGCRKGPRQAMCDAGERGLSGRATGGQQHAGGAVAGEGTGYQPGSSRGAVRGEALVAPRRAHLWGRSTGAAAHSQPPKTPSCCSTRTPVPNPSNLHPEGSFVQWEESASVSWVVRARHADGAPLWGGAITLTSMQGTNSLVHSSTCLPHPATGSSRQPPPGRCRCPPLRPPHGLWQLPRRRDARPLAGAAAHSWFPHMSGFLEWCAPAHVSLT
jgi:hypothetical protein